MAFRAVDTRQIRLRSLIKPRRLGLRASQRSRLGAKLEPEQIRRIVDPAEGPRQMFVSLAWIAVVVGGFSLMDHLTGNPIWDFPLPQVAAFVLVVVGSFWIFNYVSGLDWDEVYRQTYIDLVLSELPLYIADPDCWLSRLEQEDYAVASGGQPVPTTAKFALNMAADCYDLMRQWAGMEGSPFQFRKVSRALALDSCNLRWPSRTTETNARYAAIYDYFFDPQQELDAALEAETSANLGHNEELVEGERGGRADCGGG